MDLDISLIVLDWISLCLPIAHRSALSRIDGNLGCLLFLLFSGFQSSSLECVVPLELDEYDVEDAVEDVGDVDLVFLFLLGFCFVSSFPASFLSGVCLQMGSPETTGRISFETTDSSEMS